MQGRAPDSRKSFMRARANAFMHFGQGLLEIEQNNSPPSHLDLHFRCISISTTGTYGFFRQSATLRPSDLIRLLLPDRELGGCARCLRSSCRDKREWQIVAWMPEQVPLTRAWETAGWVRGARCTCLLEPRRCDSAIKIARDKQGSPSLPDA